MTAFAKKMHSYCVCEDSKNVVDIGLIKRNAEAQGIALQEIALLYVGLTEEEKEILKSINLLKYEAGNAVMATFTDTGDALFPEKITGAHYLAAD